MNSPEYYTAEDGTKLEIIEHNCKNPRAKIVIWPCMGGSVRMYRFPAEKFLREGFSSVLYNPRGHGKSEGETELSLTMKDLLTYLNNHNGNVPLILIGHSSGSGAIMKFGTLHGNIDRFFLISPVLDSIESLEYMYRTNTIHEFSDLVALRTKSPETVKKILSTDKWMKKEVWDKEGHTETLNSISTSFQLGTFIEEYFLHGYSGKKDLVNHRKKTEILLPLQDNWYPFETTLKLAEKNSITVRTIEKASDHFFSGGWKSAWEYILDTIKKYSKI